MGDRSWEQGLHQLIELKEGCPLTPMNTSLARITYQRFFRRYLWLAGMTGTAQEIATELWQVYRLATVTIPTNRALQRTGLGEWLFATEEEKWEAVVKRIATCHKQARPVLVGTKSVSASERLGEMLQAAGIPHVILNARQDKEEAEIVSKAGQPGRVTVATNMAGRGTDIKLQPEVAKHGGLHVVATERHEAARIDRQLYGRSGRQGDPGSFETLVSLEDDLMVTSRRLLWRWVASVLVRRGQPLQGKLAAFLIRQAQLSAESLHERIRRDLLQHEDQLETSLAFTGRLE